MANRIYTGKKSVDLGASVARESRIRRDPPPPVKVVTAAEIRERDARDIVIGIVALALAMFVILISVTNAAGWSASQYKLQFEESAAADGSA